MTFASILKQSHKLGSRISQSLIWGRTVPSVGVSETEDDFSDKGAVLKTLMEAISFLFGGRSKRASMRSVSRRGLRDWQNVAAILLIVLSVLSGLATYAALTEVQSFGRDARTVIILLNVDLVLLLSLVALIARRIVGLWSGRRRGLAGSHLHVRLVYTFSLLAAAPAILMTVFSAFFFHYGVQTWFSERIQTTVNESQAVAQAYLEEHKQVIRADILAMANDLDRQASLMVGNPVAFERIMQTQSVLRNLSEAVVFDSTGRVLARSGLTFSLELEDLPPYVQDQVSGGEVVITTGDNDDRVRALVKLNNFIDSFLYVGRMVDPQVLSHLAATKEAVESYTDLKSRYSSLQIAVTLIFVVVGLLMVLAAIWFGLLLARQLVTPISGLITAADRVRGGDLTTRVADQAGMEEFDYLGRSFNRMTRQIQEQQNDLIQANRQLDRRRRLTETVLTGVSSGVIGVDEGGVVNLANASALELLMIGSDEPITGENVQLVFPELQELLNEAHRKPGRITQAEIPFHVGEAKKTFLVRIAIEMIGDEDKGAIITFDDITELQIVQRKAAWADVARRVAHEIKNPLTPIQLSAERLKRRYLKQIQDDPDTFSQCTDTIIRHVEDIGRMVNEFSSFARMPEPVMAPGDLLAHIRETYILQKQAHPDIVFNLFHTDCDFGTLFDPQQIRQAFTNLMQNAIDSIYLRAAQQDDPEPGHIDILLDCCFEQELVVVVTDNGLGLPRNENPAHLVEPYVTHKDKGTGLGLAIVKKIMEDHKGRLILGVPDWLREHDKWRDIGGASVVLALPCEGR